MVQLRSGKDASVGELLESEKRTKDTAQSRKRKRTDHNDVRSSKKVDEIGKCHKHASDVSHGQTEGVLRSSNSTTNSPAMPGTGETVKQIIETITDPEQLALLERDDYIMGKKLPHPGRGAEPKWAPPPRKVHHNGFANFRHQTPVQLAELPPSPSTKNKGGKLSAPPSKGSVGHPKFDPDALFYDKHQCYSKGPNGSPTYDKTGFELDYEKVKTIFEASYPLPIDYEKSRRDQTKMAEIFFGKENAPDFVKIGPFQHDMWRDKVSRDLGVAFHKVSVEHFEQWEREGFPKARREDYVYEEKSEGFKERLMRFMEGGYFRK